jgi:pimeloyl-ACP methyl ester carboxylesterase
MKNLFRRLRWVLVSLLALLVIVSLLVGITAFQALHQSDLAVPTANVPAPGGVVQVTHLGTYSAPLLGVLLWRAHLPGKIAITQGADLYRLRYWTTNYTGRLTIVSGLLAVPQGIAPRGVVSYQHGTETDRSTSPSSPNLEEGVLGAAVFAGSGYLFVAPDDIGRGTSHEIEPYLYVPSEVNVTRDLLTAAQTVATHLRVAWSSRLLLLGFSEGGHATLAIQRALEQTPAAMHVVASASIAGPYDLRQVSFPFALEGHSAEDSAYLADLAYAYATVYQHPLASVVQTSYATRIPALFDGTHETDQVIAALPRQPRDLFTPTFLAQYANGTGNWFLQALAENQVDAWSPKAPVRLYYGDADVDVTPQTAIFAASHMQGLHGNVQAIALGHYDHFGSINQAISQIRAWFDALSR